VSSIYTLWRAFLLTRLGHISPVLRSVAALHNFTVESQVRLHGQLAFEPIRSGSDAEPVHGLTQDDLKVFVNSAEWSLGMYFFMPAMCLIERMCFWPAHAASQVSNDPVFHFVVFVPSLSHTPLRILDKNSSPNLSPAACFSD
jgi:phosphatidylinositol glycan class S